MAFPRKTGEVVQESLKPPAQIPSTWSMHPVFVPDRKDEMVAGVSRPCDSIRPGHVTPISGKAECAVSRMGKPLYPVHMTSISARTMGVGW